MKTTTTSNTVKSRFVLSRQNQKGQVAIFVALIFQVLFVFFALLINVGLLVHHKINLQQSVDLAAYYGAMKQAEVLNTIAHVNFQLKQNWKLLTWRYRILGTFGMIPDGPFPVSQKFPFQQIPGGFEYNGRTPAVNTPAPDTTCTAPPSVAGFGVHDIPFFCAGHSGFGGWAQSESTCKINCNNFNAARVINRIPSAGITNTPGGGTISGDIDAAITNINDNLRGLCAKLGPTNATVMARFLASYISENRLRSKTIEMLARNLSLPATEAVDIEGGGIEQGARATFRNNLTEANRADFTADESSFQVENGLSQPSCKFNNCLGYNPEFLKKIEFDFINYFIYNCVGGPASTDYKPDPMYGASGTDLSSAFSTLEPGVKDVVLSLLGTPGNQHTVGYEKNPNCIEYFAVKASASPNIPFLPLKKIKLNAVAVAKPFGGSIGPWYGKVWTKGSPRSDASLGVNYQVDETLPKRTLVGAANLDQIQTSVYFQPNFSLFVGDKLGLRNTDYVAAYHSMLAMRDIPEIPGHSYSNPNPNRQLTNVDPDSNPQAWPTLFRDWDKIDNAALPDVRQYDPLANENTGTRYLEISAIAPNQFDVTHYSIDADFYNNYYKKLYKGFDNMKNATGGAGPDDKNDLRADFGAFEPDADDDDVKDPLDFKTFAVKDQILVKNILFKATPTFQDGGYPSTYGEVYKYLVSVQSSLLTGWTFLNFSDYDTFPADEVNNIDKTMSFGQCLDEWNKTADAISSNDNPDNFKTARHTNADLPSAVGNCITGGRTGYSVKIVSPSVLRSPTDLDNPLSSNFLGF